jgi:TRAP-type C4-dicarboxylate transport system substrate-binding protein
MKHSLKRRLLTAVASAGVVGLALAGCSAGPDTTESGEETFNLVVANFNHADSPETAGLDWWLDEVERLSDGRVTFDRYHQETLCTGAEIVQCVRDGRADIGASIPSYTAGFFPISEVMNLPFQTDNPEAIATAYYNLLNETEAVANEADRHGLKTLWHVGIDTSIIGGTKPIDNVDDLKGLAVRSAGEGIQWGYEAIGANPVAVTAAEMYEAMQFGLTDVWTNNLSGADNYKMYEVSNHWRLTGLGVYINNGTWISQKTWESLPADIQAIFDQATETYLAGGEGYKVIGASLQEKCDNIVAANKLDSWDVWDAAETKRWKDALGDRAVDNWKTNVSEYVDDPDALYDRFLELLDEAEASSEFVSPAFACAANF